MCPGAWRAGVDGWGGGDDDGDNARRPIVRSHWVTGRFFSRLAPFFASGNENVLPTRGEEREKREPFSIQSINLSFSLLPLPRLFLRP